MNKKIIALMILVLIGLAFSVGYLLPREAVKVPYIVTNNITSLIYVDRPVITEKLFTVNVTTEKIVTNNVTVPVETIVNGKLKEFESVGQMTDWVNAHLCWMIGAKVDCDDYALHLQQSAYAEGYMLPVQLVFNGMLEGIHVSTTTGNHMGNITIIGNNIYWVDVTDGVLKMCLVSYVD